MTKKSNERTEKVHRSDFESTSSYPQSVRLGKELNAQVRAIAEDQGISFSAVIRTAVEVYLQREGFAGALDAVEKRLAAGILRCQTQAFRAADDVQLLIAIVDQLTQFLMIVTPEIIDKEGATALGMRRHAAFIAELHNAYGARRKRAVLADQLDALSADDL